jgi:MFS family permease
MPEFNNMISKLGGANLKGLSIILFTLSAGLSRPSAGKLTDFIGRKKVMYIGVIISVLVSFSYVFASSLIIFLLLRFFHGLCQGFFPTAATALMTDILPANRRGQGMAAFGTAISLGIGIGQGISTQLISTMGIQFIFSLSAVLAFAAGGLIYAMKETLDNPQAFKIEQLKLKSNELFEKSVAPAAIVMFLSAFCSGLIFVITPDFSGYLGIENKGWFFMVYVSSTIIVRLISGGVSDKLGRKETLLYAMLLCLISMVMLAFCETKFMYNICALIFGFATGVSSPAIFAWTADLSHPQRRGIGAGTMFIALEFGILAGSASTLITNQNTIESLRLVFLTGAASSLLACLYLFFSIRKTKSPKTTK